MTAQLAATPAPLAPTAECATCPLFNNAQLVKLGINMDNFDYIVALAGNPNTGKSTVFNALTGLRQHTGNWPGKTVARAEGGYLYGDKRYKLVDLPGTYSLLSTSTDEEIARDFILFGQPTVTVVVVDATRLERNLNLALQVLEITDQRRHRPQPDRRGGTARLADRRASAWCVTSACRSCRWSPRKGVGVPELLQAVSEVADGQVRRPSRTASSSATHRWSRRSANWSPGSRRVSPACPTRAGWRCACSTATPASSRRSVKARSAT